MRLDAYIRVSAVRGRGGESFISPDVQRQQIHAWAKLRGVEIVAEHVDLDQTGGKLQRPGLGEAMRRLRSGVTEGIAVARIDRFSRAGVADALRVVEEIHDAGGQLAAIDLGIDPTTPFGEFAMTLMLALARMQRRQIADNWSVARERAVERGIHIASRTPTGYVRESSGRLLPHPRFAAAVATAFERRAAGASWGELCRLFDELAVEGPYQAERWTSGAMQNVIRNRVYLGEARSGEFLNPDAHEPIVDRVTWEAAQFRQANPARSGEGSLLAGMIRCAGCRYPLKPDRMTLRSGERVRIYRCRGEHAAGRCEDRAAVLGTVIEPWVEAQFLARFAEQATDASVVSDTGTMLAALERAEGELAAYRDDERISDALGHERFVAGLKVRAGRVDDAHRALAEAKVEQGELALGADVAAAWPLLTTLERRKVLAGGIDVVMLRSGRKVAIEDRALIFWRGEGPSELPRRGHRVPLAGFDWPPDEVGPAGGENLGERAGD